MFIQFLSIKMIRKIGLVSSGDDDKGKKKFYSVFCFSVNFEMFIFEILNVLQLFVPCAKVFQEIHFTPK